jgi:hypothetical protein
MKGKIAGWILIVVVLHGLGFWRWMNPFGLQPISDEPLYVVLAKSLATSGEYRDRSLPGEPYHTKYPILYPLILSWVWRQVPRFPENIFYLRLLSGLFATSFLVVLGNLLFKLWEKDTILPALVLILSGLHPTMLTSSMSIMSEATYLLFSSWALWTALQLETRPRRVVWPVVCGFLLALSFYTRVAGLALIFGVSLDLVLRRRWRNLAFMLSTTTICISPWWVWCHFHNEATRLPEFIFNTNYLSDFLQVTRVQGFGSVISQNLLMIAIGIPKMMVFPYQTNLQRITQLTAWLGFPLLVLMAFGLVRALKIQRVRVLFLYLLFYLLMLVIWPYPASERFLLPMLPWFYFFLAVELREIALRTHTMFTRFAAPGKIVLPSMGWLLVSTVMAACSASLIIHSFFYARNLGRQLQNYWQDSHEMEESFQWIRDRSAPTDSLMASMNPLYYLHTDRHTAPMNFDLNQGKTKPTFLAYTIRRHHIRYLVTGELDFSVFTPEVVQAMRHELQQVLEGRDGLHFRKVFSSSKGNYAIYETLEVDPSSICVQHAK